MPRNAKQREKPFAGEAAEPGLSIEGVFEAWDSKGDIRQRLRDGYGMMHTESGLACDNAVCILNADILLPLLHIMSGSRERKLPSVGDLRSEMAKAFTTNKRVGPDVGAAVASEAIHVRKLLSHVKSKARREEVSQVFRWHVIEFWKGPVL